VTIDGSANYGKISGNVNAGGLVGIVYQGNQLEITNSYNRGDVNSTRVAGGIVGNISNASNANGTAYIVNTYNTGTISNIANSGGLAGVIAGGAVSSDNNYFLNTAANGAVSSASYDGVNAVTDTYMKSSDFVTDLGGALAAGTNGYPTLPGAEYTDPVSQKLIVWYDDEGISLENANRLFAATLWFEIESGTPVFEGLNGFSVLDETFKDGLYGVRLGYLVAGGNGFTSLDETDILSITGAEGVAVKGGQISGFDANGKPVHFEFGSVVKEPVYVPKYDLNDDGEIDQLDLVIALSWYKAAEGDANWNDAKIADYNRDKEIGIVDFMMLLQNIAW
jgi:hypothetical protein